MSKITVISDIPHVTGWAPILHMQTLLAELAGARLHDVSSERSSGIQSLIYPLYPRSRPRSREESIAICIAWSGYGARKFVPAIKALGGFSRVALWVIDSFWTNSIRREMSLIERHFDLVVYMQSFDDEFYYKSFGSRALRLEWGSDVLGLGSCNPDRELDLLRVGRQPSSWEDDRETQEACSAKGVRFSGRPPMDEPAEALVKTLMCKHYRRTKYILAHSNVAAPASNTHPSKAYMTGRWTDALASGAAVAGVPPEGDLDLIDWPEALLPFPSLDRTEGLELVAEAVAQWTPEVARRNYFGALNRLDWRWRFQKLMNALGVDAPRLDSKLAQLKEKIAIFAAGEGQPSAAFWASNF